MSTDLTALIRLGFLRIVVVDNSTPQFHRFICMSTDLQLWYGCGCGWDSIIQLIMTCIKYAPQVFALLYCRTWYLESSLHICLYAHCVPYRLWFFGDAFVWWYWLSHRTTQKEFCSYSHWRKNGGLQAYFNYRRKSTVGWSITNIVLDLSGGTANLFQMFVQSIDQRNYVPFPPLHSLPDLPSFLKLFSKSQKSPPWWESQIFGLMKLGCWYEFTQESRASDANFVYFCFDADSFENFSGNVGKVGLSLVSAVYSWPLCQPTSIRSILYVFFRDVCSELCGSSFLHVFLHLTEKNQSFLSSQGVLQTRYMWGGEGSHCC